MNTGYLDRVLNQYKTNFDIKRDCLMLNEKISAYAYFSASNEKFLLVKEVQLWETKGFEHVIFIEESIFEENVYKKVETLVKEYIEPILIRAGQKYPEKNHMYSLITVVVISNKIDENIITKIKEFKFEKNYLFSFRGYASTRLVVIDLKNKNIITNKKGKNLISLYKNLL